MSTPTLSPPKIKTKKSPPKSPFSRIRRIHWHFILAVAALLLAHPSFATNIVGAGLVFAGFLLRAWAAGYLIKGGRLCTFGPYRYIRHPLYLGSIIATLGFLTMADNIWAWLLITPTFLLLYFSQLNNEEHHLRELYGRSYELYAAQVPSLLPLHRGRVAKPSNEQTVSWSFSLVLHNKEHYHIAFAAIVIALFVIKG